MFWLNIVICIKIYLDYNHTYAVLLIYDNNHTNSIFIYCMYDFNHYICIIRNEVITIKRYTIMTTKNIIREVSYKGHIITVFEDGFHQEFVIIDNDESKLYDSIADAKRVIRGEQPYYEINWV